MLLASHKDQRHQHLFHLHVLYGFLKNQSPCDMEKNMDPTLQVKLLYFHMKYYQINLYRLENNFPQKALLHRVMLMFEYLIQGKCSHE